MPVRESDSDVNVSKSSRCSVAVRREMGGASSDDMLPIPTLKFKNLCPTNDEKKRNLMCRIDT
eukprot:CCRYP_015353-RC/>CCRYP_015353-RC protein AED:0.54 eAED:0.55 QI:107/1/0.5/1/0/0/2/0/62